MFKNLKYKLAERLTLDPIKRARIKTRNLIAKTNEKYFNMGYFVHGLRKGTTIPRGQVGHVCGTSACIAGFAVLANMPEFDEKENVYGREARRILGLSGGQSSELFMAYGAGGDMSKITKSQALRTMDILIETDEVDWSHVDNA